MTKRERTTRGSMSDFVSIKCAYLPKAIAGLKKLGVTSPQAVARGMRSWGEKTRTAAIKVTPKKWGPLRNSIFVKQESEGETRKLIIGAGGNAAPYALVIHEKMEQEVEWTTPGTGPKYIENPIRSRMSMLDDDIAKQINREIEKAMP